MKKKFEEGIDDITKEEVRKVIRKMKNRVMPGKDGITNEAWIVGLEEIEEDLTK